MFDHLKPAPASFILKELLEGKKITTEQQVQVIEHRREILVRCLKTFSQKTLGQLACLDSGDGFYHELRKDTPEVASLDIRFSLDSRGFFAGNLFSRQKDGQRLAFGLDQESWLLVKIDYFDERMNQVWPNKYEHATSVQVIRADLRTILGEMQINPMMIWTYFKIITDEWVSHRRNLYDQALAVEGDMKKESDILCQIT